MNEETFWRWIFFEGFGTSPERYIKNKKYKFRKTLRLCSEFQIYNSFFIGNLDLEEMIARFSNKIISEGKNNNIDSRAIVAAISWEYEKNRLGRWSDKLQRFDLRSGNDIGLGWGSAHTPIVKEMYPNATEYELNCRRLDASTAIEIVGKIMGVFAKLYYEQSHGIWINPNPAVLAFFYNTGRDTILRSAKTRRLKQCLPNQRVTLEISINPMAKWVQKNLDKFREFKTNPKPPLCSVPIIKAI